MIFIHIGMHKTGTTYLQNNVFPYWKNIEYLGKRGDKRCSGMDLIDYMDIESGKKYLVSNEDFEGFPMPPYCYSNMDTHIFNLNKQFPDANIMVSFRKPDDFIVSLYKQYLHKGGYKDLTDFFDIEHNTGMIKKENISYIKLLYLIDQYFEKEPFIFLQEELKNNMDGLLSDFAEFFGEEKPKKAELGNSIENKGIGYYQGKILKRVNKYCKSDMNSDGFLPLYNRYFTHLRLTPQMVCREKLDFLSSKPINLDERRKQLIMEYYSDEWNYVKKRLSENIYRKNYYPDYVVEK